MIWMVAFLVLFYLSVTNWHINTSVKFRLLKSTVPNGEDKRLATYGAIKKWIQGSQEVDVMLLNQS